MLDTTSIRKHFPIYEQHPDLVYLDSGASSLKVKTVIDKMDEYYTKYGVNVHRGVYNLSHQASEEYEEARDVVANFINAKSKEIVFTKGTTSALNLVAASYGLENVESGDEIIVSELEHHSNLLPWQRVARIKGAKLRYIPLDTEGRITVEGFLSVLSPKTKVVAITYVSNVMGYITPIKEIIKIAHERNIVVVVDAAQAIQHLKVDVKDLDCDFLAFSGHKMCGPTGVGVLYGKYELLEKMPPLELGGDMNDDVQLYDATYKVAPYKFEAGTPPIAEVIGLKEAIYYLEKLGFDNIQNHVKELADYAIGKMKAIDGVTVYNPTAETGIIAFNIDGVHPHDAATNFDENQICLRAGHHCAQLVTKWLRCVGTLRATIYIYNNKHDIDTFIETLINTRDFFKQF